MHDAPPKSCCTPTRGSGALSFDTTPNSRDREQGFDDTVVIPAGRAFLGTRTQMIRTDFEGPLRRRQLETFKMDRTAVTTSRFAQFVKDTGYTTDAERIGWSFVFHDQLAKDHPATKALAGIEWWRAVDGANWRCITGGGDTTTRTADHPVVHVSSHDAQAFARWAGGRLPSEVEWEHAARGGLADVKYPWGDDEPDDSGPFRCNIWQGEFPQNNTGADGYTATAPASSFDANGYGLMNMVGNVWEWTADPFVNDVMRRKVGPKITPEQWAHVLLKGGSYLCHKSYCYRYRIAARTGNTADSASTHMGFRVIY